MSEKMDNNFGQLLGALRALAQPPSMLSVQQAPPTSTSTPPLPAPSASPPPTQPFMNPAFVHTPPNAMDAPPLFPLRPLTQQLHELRPQQLHKLITSTNVKQLNPNSLFMTTDGLQIAEASLSRKLPSFALFIRALTVYLDILTNHIALTTNNSAMVCHIAHGGFFYLKMLNYYSSIYSYKAILDFHMVFHAKRLREMEQGNYSGWGKIDSDAVAEVWDIIQIQIEIGHLPSGRSLQELQQRQMCFPLSSQPPP
ncbi:hypothetical protein PC9H_010071 [Pleurotus ostreatus]|uniref:Uncharacterized protein n=1 Tax=Pleurotus ostreatus TaxID=5322 RepID=A0A8H6ZUX8_PLEOS|nr:uncharacterized protein PC9H_010071 [Pleurotus ostreatus]KAF7424760.1 hypothetical protein PC9H_010071 [Pleurotus ostreatus]